MFRQQTEKEEGRMWCSGYSVGGTFLYEVPVWQGALVSQIPDNRYIVQRFRNGKTLGFFSDAFHLQNINIW